MQTKMLVFMPGSPFLRADPTLLVQFCLPRWPEDTRSLNTSLWKFSVLCPSLFPQVHVLTSVPCAELPFPRTSLRLDQKLCDGQEPATFTLAHPLTLALGPAYGTCSILGCQMEISISLLIIFSLEAQNTSQQMDAFQSISPLLKSEAVCHAEIQLPQAITYYNWERPGTLCFFTPDFLFIYLKKCMKRL